MFLTCIVLYFTLVFIKCFLEKDDETFCSQTEMEEGDMDVYRVLDNGTLTPPSFEEHILPHEIFEKFFTTEEMERIRLESIKYARHKGNHSFMMTIKKLKSFILVLSVYNQFPRQEMYQKRKEDSQNRMFTVLMTKNEVEECKQFPHFAENESLDKTADLPNLDFCCQCLKPLYGWGWSYGSKYLNIYDLLEKREVVMSNHATI